MYLLNAARALELAGDLAGAERRLLARWKYFSSTMYDGLDRRVIENGYALANFYCDEGRWDEAETFAARYRELPLSGGNVYRASRSRLAVEARLAAHHGLLDEAVWLAEQAVAALDPDDYADLVTRVWLALAEVQRAAGNAARSTEVTAMAIERFERKGNVAAAALVRADFL
jgi:hypothetical protein